MDQFIMCSVKGDAHSDKPESYHPTPQFYSAVRRF